MTALRFHIDHALWQADDHAPLAILGWCAWTDGRTLTRLTAHCGSRLLGGVAPSVREDVARVLGSAAARLSGFDLRLPFVEPEDSIRLLAEDSAGGATVVAELRAGDFPGRDAIIANYASLRATGWGEWVPPSTSALDLRGNFPPRISVLVPLHNTPARFLRECLGSLFEQSYANWELCIVDDASDKQAGAAFVRELAGRDPRVRFERLSTRQGIARCTNRALALASGDYVAFLDHDDRLRQHALHALAETIVTARQQGADCDVLYTDEEKILESGAPERPVLKPRFSADFLQGVMYVGHLLCVRRSLAVELGGLDPRFDGIQDFEFVLRLSEKARRIVHVPGILYQWRSSATSSAQQGNVKGDMDALQERAVVEHLARTGRSATVRLLGNHRLLLLPPGGFVRPPITLLATSPATAGAPLADLADVTIVQTSDLSPMAPQAMAAMLRVRHPDIWNAGGLIGFLAEPLLDASSDWLDHLAFLALQPGAGAVSPVLRSVEGKVLESGRARSPGGWVPIMRGFDPAVDGYHGALACHREVDCASPACWLLRADWQDAREPCPDRVCASAWVQLGRSWAERPPPIALDSAAEFAEPFFHRGFDPNHADYRLNGSEPAGFPV